MNNNPVRNLALTAMLVALGLVLPFLTGQIPQIGSMLLPMHIPVFLCGLICGWKHGAAIGLLLPPMRYLLFGMPALFPTGAAMSIELAAYGLIAGLIYQGFRKQGVISVCIAMIPAMLAGRALWGIAQVMLLGFSGKAFTWQLFIAGAFVNAVPGIIVQLALIPALMAALDKSGLMRFRLS